MSAGAFSKAVAVKDTKTSSYGEQPNAAGLAAGVAIPLLSETLEANVDRDEAPILAGKSGLSEGEVISYKAAGSLRTALMYNDLDVLLGMALGFEHPIDSPASESALYRHVYEIDDVLHRQHWLTGEGWSSGGGLYTSWQKVRSGCIAIDKAVNDHANDSCMIRGFTLQCGTRETYLDLDIAYWKKRRADLTSGSWPALTDIRRIVFPQATLEIGSVDGTTYPDAEISFQNFTIVYNSQLRDSDFGSTTGVYIMEPVRDGFTTIEGTLTPPRYTSDLLSQHRDNTVEFRLRLTFANGDRRLIFCLPLIVLTTDTEPVESPAAIQQSFGYRAFKPYALTATENAFRSGGEWEADLGGITLLKNNMLTVITVNDRAANFLTER